MRNFLCWSLRIAVLWALSASPWAAVITDPIPYRNVSPMAQIVGLPRFSGGSLVPHGGTRMQLIAETANDFSSAGSLAEDAVSLDGETSVFTVSVRHAVLDWLEVGLEVPYVVHSSGRMDWLIDTWHDINNLNDNGRGATDRNQLRYLLVLDAQPLIDITSRKDGIGDIRVLFGSLLLRGERSLAMRGSLKLPTGDEDDLIGSGGTDFAFSMAYTDTRVLPFDLVMSAEAGLVVVEDDALLSRQEPGIYFGGVSIVYALERWAFKGQITGHSKIYESSASHLGDYGLQGALGVGVRISDRFALEGSVIEDLKSGSTVDVTFQLALTTTL